MSSAAAASPSRHTRTPPRRRVLVVDDNRAIRQAFSVFLRAEFVVEVAENGTTALRRIAEWRPDVVTLDLQMPGVDGLTVIQRLRDMRTAPPVIVVSGSVSSPDPASFGLPVVAVLSKPVYPAELVAACQRALSPPGAECRAFDDDEGAAPRPR